MNKKTGIVLLTFLMTVLLTACNLNLPSIGKDDGSGKLDIFGEVTGGETNDNQNENGQDAPIGKFNIIFDEHQIMNVDTDGNIKVLYKIPDKETMIKNVVNDDDDVYFMEHIIDDDYYSKVDVLYHIAIDGSLEQVDIVYPYTVLDIYKNKLYAFDAGTYKYDYETNTEYPNEAYAYHKAEDGEYVKEIVEEEFVFEAFNMAVGCFSEKKPLSMLNNYGYFAELTNYPALITTYDENLDVIDQYNLGDDYVYNLVFDGQYIVYCDEDYENEIYTHYIFDINTKERKVLNLGEGKGSFRSYLEFKDGVIFYDRFIAEENAQEYYQVFMYDLSKGEQKELMKIEDIPGIHGKDTCLWAEELSYFNGKVYYKDKDINKTFWAKYDPASDVYEPTDIVVDEYNIGKYGKVTAESNNFYGPNDNLLFTYYIEKLEITADFPGKDAMNQRLDELFTEWQRNCDREDEVIDGYDPEWGDYYYESEEFELSSIVKVSDRFLWVLFEGYEYYGGAHGFPIRYGILFDVNTGMEANISEMTSISEEEFKSKVADYSMEFYYKYSEMFFDMESDESLKQSFYDGASFDMNLEYGENKLYVVYSPYEYGPYASGYMIIEIPYEDLEIVLD